MEEFANFDFNIWRKRYIQWISHMKSRILDVFRCIDRDQDGRISHKEFVDYVLASSKTFFPVINLLKPSFLSWCQVIVVSAFEVLFGLCHIFVFLCCALGRVSNQFPGDECRGKHF